MKLPAKTTQNVSERRSEQSEEFHGLLRPFGFFGQQNERIDQASAPKQCSDKYNGLMIDQAIHRRTFLVGSLAALATPALGESRLTFDAPQVSRWRIGLILTTPVTCTNVFATFPVPINWPEQTVTVENSHADRLVTKWKVRETAPGVSEVVVQMARVPAGARAEMTMTVSIQRSRILPPSETDDLVIPKRPSRELRNYLGNSPFIDASNARIRTASKELAATNAVNDWDRVEQIYDYVRENVKYVEGKLKNASQALRDGTGDCEEMTSLFVALCRNAKVPARMVWIPDHCYPEFYLEDGQGNGHWFPCQAAGTQAIRSNGRVSSGAAKRRSIQSAREKRTPQRYVAEFFKCDRKGKQNPRPQFVREMIEVWSRFAAGATHGRDVLTQRSLRSLSARLRNLRHFCSFLLLVRFRLAILS